MLKIGSRRPKPGKRIDQAKTRPRRRVIAQELEKYKNGLADETVCSFRKITKKERCSCSISPNS